MRPIQPITPLQRAAMECSRQVVRRCAPLHQAKSVARRLMTRDGRLTKTGLNRLAVKSGRQPEAERVKREAEAARRKLALDLVQGR